MEEESEYKEITLNDILPNDFYANDDGEMVAEIKLDTINLIAYILTTLQDRLDRAIYYAETNKLSKELIDILEGSDVKDVERD